MTDWMPVLLVAVAAYTSSTARDHKQSYEHTCALRLFQNPLACLATVGMNDPGSFLQQQPSLPAHTAAHLPPLPMLSVVVTFRRETACRGGR